MERDEKIMKKMVTNIVENNEKVLGQEPDTNKFSKIVPTLLKKGLDNINLSMFSPELKFSILTALGEGYKRKGNLNDAVKSFVLAENKEKLNEVAKDTKGCFSSTTVLRFISWQITRKDYWSLAKNVLRKSFTGNRMASIHVRILPEATIFSTSLSV